jgi:RNA helicase
VTSHSSQGETADRVIVYLDRDRAGEKLVNQRLAYVAVSRGRHDAQIYTDDRESLAYLLSRDASKSSALAPRAPDSISRAQHARGERLVREHEPTLARQPGGVVQGATDGADCDRPSARLAATRHPADQRFSDQELQRAREYLELPATRAYLRGRDDVTTGHGPGPTPVRTVAIEPRHVAVVLRRLPPDAHGRYTAADVRDVKQTPAMILRAAQAEASAEHRAGQRARGHVAGASVHHSTAHATGLSRS